METEEKECVYCGAVATTRDHLPTRNLFPDTKLVQFLKIPACLSCNNGLSKDELFFRDLVAALGLETSISAKLLFNSKIRSSVQRNPSVAKRIFSMMDLVDLMSPGGIILDTKTKVTIQKEEKERIDRVVTKYAKGLFYHHFGQPMPKDHSIRITILPGKLLSEKAEVLSIVKTIPPVRKFLDVFAYGYATVPETKNVVWLMSFYGKMSLLVMTVDQEVVERNESETQTKVNSKE